MKVAHLRTTPARACRSRAEHRAKARALWQQGNKTAAYECYQRAVDISPAVAKGFIDVRAAHALCLLQLSLREHGLCDGILLVCASRWVCWRECSVGGPSCSLSSACGDNHLNAWCATVPFWLVLQALQQRGVEFIVAPYEADAQIAYLALNGLVDVVITEDSDLLAYGCPRVSCHAVNCCILACKAPCCGRLPGIGI